MKRVRATSFSFLYGKIILLSGTDRIIIVIERLSKAGYQAERHFSPVSLIRKCVCVCVSVDSRVLAREFAAVWLKHKGHITFTYETNEIQVNVQRSLS